MEFQGRVLQRNDKGEDVRLLHHELTRPAFEITAPERSRAWFGAETRQAAYAFQQRHSLEAIGIVDQKTAIKINPEVDCLSPEETYLVRDVVIDHRRRGLAGLPVVVVDKNVGRAHMARRADYRPPCQGG